MPDIDLEGSWVIAATEITVNGKLNRLLGNLNPLDVIIDSGTTNAYFDVNITEVRIVPVLSPQF